MRDWEFKNKVIDIMIDSVTLDYLSEWQGTEPPHEVYAPIIVELPQDATVTNNPMTRVSTGIATEELMEEKKMRTN